MHHLVGHNPVARPNRREIRIVTQIAVAGAIGIRHLGHHGIKLIGCVKTEPETDRVEHMPQHARLGQQGDAHGLGHIQRVKLIAQPDRSTSFTGLAPVVAVAPVGDVGPVQ